MIKKNYSIVDTYDSRLQFITKLKEWPYLAFDTETTGLNVRKCKMIGFSVCGEAGVSFYYPLYEWNGSELVPISHNLEYVREILELIKTKELLTWNGSFDIRVVENNFGIDLTDSLIADGMLLKHTLNEEGPFALKKVGIEIQREIGLNVEEEANKEQIEMKENVKKNGGSTTVKNFEMFKADLPVIGTYACADADLTFRICEYYFRQLQKEGLEAFFFDEEVMPLYKKVTIPMEKAGVTLDLPLINRLNAEIQVDIDKLEQRIEQELFDLDETKAWLKDQTVAYVDTKPTGSFAQEYINYFGISCPRSEKTGKYLLGQVTVPPGSEHERFFNGDMSALAPEDEFEIKRTIIRREEGKLLNIFSKKQMGAIVFDYMGYTPLSETEKGNPQFNEEFIQSLADQGVHWAKLLSDYNKLIKVKGSYIDRFLEGQEDGKYYFSYKQHGTISGRYGSDAQQLPRPQEDGSEVVLKYSNAIRKFFISEPGRVFVDCDYESLEPHTFAHVSGDAGLRDIFTSNKDFYSKIAIDTEGLHEYSAVKTDENYLGKKNKAKRQSAKIYALGIPYGMGGYALGKNLAIPTEEAEILVEGYLSAYPDLKDWMDRSKRQAQYEGAVRSEVGRVRHLGKVKEIHGRFGEKLLNMKFRNKLSASFGKEYILGLYLDYKNGINNARNFQIQSMAASIVNRAAIKINLEFQKRGIDGYVCAQIHDQLIFNIPEGRADECKTVVQDVMENNIKLSVKLKAPPQLGRNWHEAH